MGEDEVLTVETLKRYREIISMLVLQYSGRVVDSPGDNILAEFSSVVDAVECAVKIQEDLKEKNASLPDNRRMEFRIGVNLGDVIEEGERIYGDGVNIAARLESLADGGGICISGMAYDQVENKLRLVFEYLGEQTVKNISKPVRVHRVKMGSAVTTGVQMGDEVQIPDKPSIAVLPFVNMSGDPEQEYFSDGMSEEIITGLSKIPEMHVIARNSSFVYKEKPVKAQQVGKELGVRYVLEGSVRKAGNRIRVTAQLIDTVTGYHLWAERYDRELNDIFALQDEISMKILTCLQVELTDGEQALIGQGSTSNLEAWGYAVRSSGVLESGTKEGIMKARALLDQAVALDSQYVNAWVGLALTHWFEARFGWSDSPTESIKQTSIIAEKVLSLDATNPEVHALLGCIHLYLREYEQAIQEAERAVALGPSHAFVHSVAAHILRFSGKYDQALALVKKAMRLQPYLPSWYLMELGMSYYCIGRYEEAKDAAEQFRHLAQSRDEEILWAAYIILTMSYIRLGRDQDARRAVADLIRLYPDYSLEVARRYACYQDPNMLERQLDDLRKAGLN
jgi:adenylate cyclase